jgi:hypothetical protein
MLKQKVCLFKHQTLHYRGCPVHHLHCGIHATYQLELICLVQLQVITNKYNKIKLGGSKGSFSDQKRLLLELVQFCTKLY